MHPRDCPTWEYKNHQFASAVGIRCEQILDSLAKGQLAIDATLRDTRAVHGQIFINLTPHGCPYYAGHYRGEKFRCLRYMRVRVLSDARVGAAPERVAPELANFTSHVVNAGLKALQDCFSIPDETLPPEDKLYNLVVFACRALAEFLRIHPYVNGNGHMGRMLIWVLLVKFGYWPQKWPLDTSPPYHELLKRFRDGDELPLQRFVLESIIG